MRKSYPTDLSDAEWNSIEPHMPTPKGHGRPRVRSPLTLRMAKWSLFLAITRRLYGTRYSEYGFSASRSRGSRRTSSTGTRRMAGAALGAAGRTSGGKPDENVETSALDDLVREGRHGNGDGRNIIPHHHDEGVSTVAQQ